MNGEVIEKYDRHVLRVKQICLFVWYVPVMSVELTR